MTKQYRQLLPEEIIQVGDESKSVFSVGWITVKEDHVDVGKQVKIFNKVWEYRRPIGSDDRVTTNKEEKYRNLLPEETIQIGDEYTNKVQSVFNKGWKVIKGGDPGILRKAKSYDLYLFRRPIKDEASQLSGYKQALLSAANYAVIEPLKNTGVALLKSVRYVVLYSVLAGIGYGIYDPSIVGKCLPKIRIEWAKSPTQVTE